MKKSLIALATIAFAALSLGGAANAETASTAKSLKTYKIKLLKPSQEKFALEHVGEKKVKRPFVYDGPRDAFFINGIN